MSRPLLILQYVQQLLAAITKVAPYKTGIGIEVQLHRRGRTANALPACALVVSGGGRPAPGSVDPATGKPYVATLRTLDFEIEATAAAGPLEAQQVALDMLADIELATSACGHLAGVRSINLGDWSISERPGGSDAVCITVNGSAEYLYAPPPAEVP